jgi:2-dehydropantoate 2-reductase
MHTVIVGQGAIGLLCYHRLSRLNISNEKHASVSLWPSTATTVTQYTFHEINEQGNNFPLVLANKKTLINAQVIIVCVKSYQVASALQNIIDLISKHAIIILAHNGLGVFEEIQHLLKPTQCILALLLTQGAKKNADYHIEHTGIGNSDLGVIRGALQTKVLQELLCFLQKGLSQVHWQNNIQQAQWRKLAINCVINPITALENIENGEINQPVYQEKIQQLIHEIVAVATIEGLNLTTEVLLELVNKVAKNTAKNTSSMRADILANRRTEINYINGYVHRLGKKYQLATPMNTQLWLAITLLEESFDN